MGKAMAKIVIIFDLGLCCGRMDATVGVECVFASYRPTEGGRTSFIFIVLTLVSVALGPVISIFFLYSAAAAAALQHKWGGSFLNSSCVPPPSSGA